MAPAEIRLASFACPQCGADMDKIPQLFPKAVEGQEKTAPGAACLACGWTGQFGDALKRPVIRTHNWYFAPAS